MKTLPVRMLVLLCLIRAIGSPAATLYVDLNSPGPAAPYATWATAATNIQDAVDAALPGDTVLVTNGIYATGARVTPGLVGTNRVVVTSAVTVESVNGPSTTVIKGFQVAGTTNGPSAIRCVYLSPGAVLSGFTLTNGASPLSPVEPVGGGVFYFGSGGGGGGIVTNCVIVGNSAARLGGGAYGVTLWGCTVMNNTTTVSNNQNGGGGAAQCTLIDCTLANNSSSSGGGGAYMCAMTNCTLTSNFAFSGGGAVGGSLTGCLLVGNVSGGSGGGTSGGVLNNCQLIGNVAHGSSGGGGGSATNCQFIGNTAITGFGGGFSGLSATGCLFVSNTAVSGGGAAWVVKNIFASVVFTNCYFIGNQASSNGGGFVGYADMYGCIFVSNTAAFSGGAVAGVDITEPFDAPFLRGCFLSNNVAGVLGGGSYQSYIISCLVTANSAPLGGGSAFDQLYGCTMVNNSAASAGGGEYLSAGTNCILLSNTAPVGANYSNAPAAPLSYSCTTPMPISGFNNMASDPLFIDFANGNYRLRSNSPCINSGFNTRGFSLVSDADGNPRISGGTVDMGAYEFQNPASTISYTWLQQYGLPDDGSADFADPDGDGMNNYQEWRAGTNPTNVASVLALLSPITSGSNLMVTWQSVTNSTYYLQRTVGLSPSVFQTIATNIPGQSGTTSFADTNAPAPGPWFYRIGVQ